MLAYVKESMQILEEIIKNNLVFVFLFFGGFLLLLSVFLVLIYLRLRKTPLDIFKEEEAENLEDILIFQSKSIKALDKDIQALYEISNKINSLSLKGIHKTGLVRFNPFKDVGGDQSFSLALLNGKNDGIVLTSLFTRDGTRIYAKSIKEGKTIKHPLSKEEEKALKEAQKKQNNKKSKK